MTPARISYDNNIGWLKSEFGDEVVVPSDGGDQQSRERVGNRKSVEESQHSRKNRWSMDLVFPNSPVITRVEMPF